MNFMDLDLRSYLRRYKNLTWRERIKIIFQITEAIYFIHKENKVHRDLHSGNVLYSQMNQSWSVSDLGLCGPADKSSKSIYGNLPYIAPEIITGKGYSFASDIYSIGILMCEISSGQIPFANLEHDLYLALKILKGIRPQIISGIPLEYETLMKECWDADPTKRPDIALLLAKIEKIYQF